eukprot:Nk52_evm4s913 gene=Nk52_evmTU4s913
MSTEPVQATPTSNSIKFFPQALDFASLTASYEWVQPQCSIDREGVEAVLTPEQVQQWCENGFCLVEGVFPAEIIDTALEDLKKAFPEPNSVQDADQLAKTQDFGSGDVFEFPTSSKACNDIAFHPRMLRAVSQLLQCSDDKIRLTQHVPWAKYGTATVRDEFFNQDQRVHCDFPNHTLAVPPSWDRPEVVSAILYYSDCETAMGPTALVARKEGDADGNYTMDHLCDTSGVKGVPYINNRASNEAYLERERPDVFAFRRDQLYKMEKKARYGKGTLLLYRHDVWHRGTPVRPGRVRYAHNLVYKHVDCEWVTGWNSGWAKNMYGREQRMERWMAQASVEARTCLGFPVPGHPYWTRDTLEGVRHRYACYGMDMRPYEEAMERKEKEEMMTR